MRFCQDEAKDVQRFAAGYRAVSPGLAARLRNEVKSAIAAIQQSPASAGHFLNLGSKVVPELRRRNRRAFPFCILYGTSADLLVFGSVIPSRSDPLTWLTHFQRPPQ